MSLKHWVIALALALLLALAGQLFAPRTPLEDKLVRLHVLAESDRDQDQVLKLAVRDAVLAAAGETPVADRALLCRMTEAARAALREAGEERPVAVTLERYYFDTRY